MTGGKARPNYLRDGPRRRPGHEEVSGTIMKMILGVRIRACGMRSSVKGRNDDLQRRFRHRLAQQQRHSRSGVFPHRADSFGRESSHKRAQTRRSVSSTGAWNRRVSYTPCWICCPRFLDEAEVVNPSLGAARVVPRGPHSVLWALRSHRAVKLFICDNGQN